MLGYNSVPLARGISSNHGPYSSGGSGQRWSDGMQQQPSKFAKSIAKSMTIDEMRYLHQRALNDAEAKRTELKLVLASRYRELVGSSDEVIKMKERAQELNDLVQALPSLMEKLTQSPPTKGGGETKEIVALDLSDPSQDTVLSLRQNLSHLPQLIYRALDKNDVHLATTTLITLFAIVAELTDTYPLANLLSRSEGAKFGAIVDGNLDLQIRITFLQVQALPDKICRIASNFLLRSASFGKHVEKPSVGAKKSSSALASLHLLELGEQPSPSDWLLSTYFDSKAKVLQSLLGKLTSAQANNSNQKFEAGLAEEILSKIVLVLQYDVILHPYQIFVLRELPLDEGGADSSGILESLPYFDRETVRGKASKFLLTHLQLIRSKVKSVLVSIAGTTASALGQIRQSLYDKTDGVECIQNLNENGVCTWDDAVSAIVDNQTVFNNAGDASHDIATQKFSIWGALFSSTFSSLVHSLLTAAFQSVHSSVISSLRSSLSNAPQMTSIFPHEAYINTLKIATNLDEALLKVSEDAHELLVHAEERIESERRLRQSLYVQTCEILGRLICELRRIAFSESDVKEDATKELIIGRLCYLLKFRLTSVPTLLSSDSSPVSMLTTIGMISFEDLKSAFELADHDERGFISFEEAMGAVESAFAGTPFHGAEMVRETLLLSADGKDSASQLRDTPSNVTLGELSLLTARGLRHEKSGSESALGILQNCLDDIIVGCFRTWSTAVLSSSAGSFRNGLEDFLATAIGMQDDEWRRMFASGESPLVSLSDAYCKGVSPYFAGFFLECAFVVSRNTCPSDSIYPVPGKDYLANLGIDVMKTATATLTETMRRNIFHVAFRTVLSFLDESLHADSGLNATCRSAVLQLYSDVKFFLRCLEELDGSGLNITKDVDFGDKLNRVKATIDNILKTHVAGKELVPLNDAIDVKHQYVLESSDLFFSSMFTVERKTSFSPSGELVGNVTGNSMFYLPISSTRRFVLLPVQADHSLNDIQLRGMYNKEKDQTADKTESASANVMSSGFGFFSSMLKKK